MQSNEIQHFSISDLVHVALYEAFLFGHSISLEQFGAQHRHKLKVSMLFFDQWSVVLSSIDGVSYEI